MNKQAERSRQWQAEALLKRMQTTSFEKISITDITQTAGVSRLTFYRNFESKEDILRYYFQNLFEEYLQSITEDLELRAVLVHSFTYIQRESKLIRLILRQGLDPLIQKPFDDYFRTVLEKITLPKELNHFQKRFLAGGIFFIMIDWIQDDRGLSPEKIAEEILALVDMETGAAAQADGRSR